MYVNSQIFPHDCLNYYNFIPPPINIVKLGHYVNLLTDNSWEIDGKHNYKSVLFLAGGKGRTALQDSLRKHTHITVMLHGFTKSLKEEATTDEIVNKWFAYFIRFNFHSVGLFAG